MRWPFVVWALGCSGTPRPPPVATHAELPTAVEVADEDRGIVLDQGVIACGELRTELPVALAITEASQAAVVAASPHGVIRVARTTDSAAADLLQTWAVLHQQLEGPLAFGLQLDANLSYRDGTLVIDYAMAHGTRLRFAYRRTPRCTVSAIERAAEPSGAVDAVAGPVRMTWEPVTSMMQAAGAYECWARRGSCRD